MRKITKLFVVLALCCTFAFADGDMENGGRTGCTENCPPPPTCTENCGDAISFQNNSEDAGPANWILVTEEVGELLFSTVYGI